MCKMNGHALKSHKAPKRGKFQPTRKKKGKSSTCCRGFYAFSLKKIKIKIKYSRFKNIRKPSVIDAT